jgi:hypothetical protein
VVLFYVDETAITWLLFGIVGCWFLPIDNNACTKKCPKFTRNAAIILLNNVPVFVDNIDHTVDRTGPELLGTQNFRVLKLTSIFFSSFLEE